MNSTQYNDFAANYSEVELPNFYLSKEIEENDRYKDLFTFNFNINSRNNLKDTYIMNTGVQERTEEQIQQMRNIFLGKNAQRYGVNEKSLFPYAVDIKINFKDIDITSTLLDKYELHRSSISLIDSLPKTNVSFDVTTVDFENKETTPSVLPLSLIHI